MNYGGPFTSFSVTVSFSPDPEYGGSDPTVANEVQFVRDQVDQFTFTDVTGEFDLAVDGGTVLTSATTTGGDTPIPRRTHVIYPHPGGVVNVQISPNQQIGCPEASARIHRRLVESRQPA
jgi:hypothetical protein